MRDGETETEKRRSKTEGCKITKKEKNFLAFWKFKSNLENPSQTA
jgi:hypothetical protein